jgi:hypothetical protein
MTQIRRWRSRMLMLLGSLGMLVVLLNPCVSVAQAPSGADTESRVRSLDDQERLAALKRDVPALERLWSADMTVNAPTTASSVDVRRIWMSSYAAASSTSRSSIAWMECSP